jgi:plasmid stability protein
VESQSSTVAVITRVPREMKQELVDRALEHDRSVSAELRVMLRGALRAERQGSREGAS